MRKREINGFQKNLSIWTFGLALGMGCVSCGMVHPRPEPPPSSSRVETAPAPDERPPAAPPITRETIYAPREPEPAAKEPPPASNQEAEEPKTKEAFYVHTVRWSGETLSIIAAWYIGDGKNWKPLTQANPEMNPNVIYEGDNILIPENLLKTREPLPKTFVDRFHQKSNREKTRSTPQPAQSQKDELKLFGPKKN